MMKYIINFSIILSISLLFSACSSHQRASEILQSNSAVAISRDYQDLIKLLIKYKKILDLRNPSLYDKNLSKKITFNLEHSYNTINLLPNNSYEEYLKKAFDEGTQNRNDYLILGLYKMFYKTYNIKGGHKLTALGYDTKTFKNLYYTLRIIKWKIDNTKDKNGRFLFATWQLNWQLELNKKYHHITIDDLKNLPSLKSKKETLLDHSNFNFEVTFSLMTERIKNSLKTMGEEPLNLSISAMKAIILL